MLAATAPLRKAITGGVKWTPAAQMHLTLKFLGEFDAAHMAQLQEKLAGSCTAIGPIETAATTTGYFPPKAAARILWYGIEAAPALIQLARLVEDACASFGYAREKRPFSPHFTIGRVRRDASPAELRTIQQALNAFAPKERHAFTITNLHFVHSTLTPSGPEYRDLFAIPL